MSFRLLSFFLFRIANFLYRSLSKYRFKFYICKINHKESSLSELRKRDFELVKEEDSKIENKIVKR